MTKRTLFRLAAALVGLWIAGTVCAQSPPSIGTALQSNGASPPQTATLNLNRSERDWLRRHPVIRVAFDGYFPPYSYFDDDGHLVGLAVDVFALLERKLGVRFEIAPQTVWKELFAAAQRREIDVVATMGHRPEREAWFVFTRPYIFKSLVILTHADNTAIRSPNDLGGRPVALVRDYQYVRELLQQHPAIRPVWVDTMHDGLLAVATGRAEATISFLGAAHYLKARYQISNLKIAAVLERDRYSESIGVRNDWPTLALLLDRALADIPEGEMLALQQKWLGPENVPAPLLPPHLFWALTTLLAGAVLLSGGALIWNRLLRTQVRQRTMQLEEQLAQLEQTRQELAESEQRFRSIFNTTGDALFIHDLATGQILDVNQTMCDMYGLTREEALRCSVEDLSSGVPPYTQKEALMWLDRAMVNGPQLFEWQARRKNGELFWAEVNMRRALIGANERIIVSVRDISERQKAREAAETSNRSLQALNRLLAICAETLDLDRLLERILEETCSLTGLEGGTICFVDDDATLHLATHRNASHETVEDLSTQVIRVGDCLCGNCAKNGIPLILEDRDQVLQYATREATRNEPIHYHAAFPLNSGQRCVGVLCLFTRTRYKPDPTHIRMIETIAPQLGIAMDNARLYRQSRAHEALLEKRVAERTAELKKANEQLKEIDRLKSMFIASMSHELRTPLNSIIGFSSILLNEWTGPLNDEQKENMETVLRAGRHLLALINDVIDVSKIEAGLLEVETVRFDLAGLLGEIQATFAREAAAKGLELSIEPAAIELIADRRRLWQILANLVGNAIKYTERGRVEVSAERTEAGGGLRLEIRDTGIGIAKEQLGSLFQPFRRLESHLTTEEPGTGLGLYLTRKMVEDIFAGHIEVTSRPGAGSTFTVTLPGIVAAITDTGEAVS